MLSEYLAVCPAVTVAEADAPEATAKLKSSPVPDSATVWGVAEALSVTERLPVLAPPAVGLKVTVMVQFAATESVPPQLFVSEKSPLTEMAEIVSGAGPGLASVAACAGLVVPTHWAPKDKLDGKPVAFVASNPNTPTPFVVPTYTFPLAIVGVMNLFPAPN